MNSNMGPPSGTTVVRNKRGSRSKGLPNVPYRVPNREPQPSSAIPDNNRPRDAKAPRILQPYQITQDYNTFIGHQPVYPNCPQVPGQYNGQQQRVGRPVNRLSVLHELQIADFIIDSMVARMRAADKAACANGGTNSSEESPAAGDSGPITTVASRGGPISTVGSQNGPITTVGSRNGPMTTADSQNGPITPVGSRNGPMTTADSQNGPMTTLNNQSGPMMTVGGQSGPMKTGGTPSELNIRPQPRLLADNNPTGPYPPVFNPHSQNMGMQMNAGNLGRVTAPMGSFVNDPTIMNQVARGVANLNVGQTGSSPLGFMPHFSPNTMPTGSWNTMGTRWNTGYTPPAGHPTWPGMDPRNSAPSNRKEANIDEHSHKENSQEST